MNKIINTIYKFKTIFGETDEKISTDYKKSTITIIGDRNTGKTSIFDRIINNEFSEKYFPTINADFEHKHMNVNNKDMNIRIWDISGDDKYWTTVNNYYKNNTGAIIITFDITNKESFKNADNKIKYIRAINKNNPHLYLVGTKVDLASDHSLIDTIVENDIVSAYCNKNKIKYCYTSAKLGFNIESLFNEICKDILKQIKK